MRVDPVVDVLMNFVDLFANSGASIICFSHLLRLSFGRVGYVEARLGLRHSSIIHLNLGWFALHEQAGRDRSAGRNENALGRRIRC